MAAQKQAGDSRVRLVPVPGLNFESVDATAEEAAELLASGSFMREDAPVGHLAVGPGGQPHPGPDAPAAAPEQPAAPAEG